MGYSSSDAAYDAHMADEEHKALEEAHDEALRLAGLLTAEWAATILRPAVGAELTVGGDDQPLFVFSIDVDLADDLAADEYPMDDLRELANELRDRVAGTPVDDWSWLVEVGTKARRTYV